MLQAFYDYIFHFFNAIDYWAVFAMMLIEASVIPFPSEIPMLAVGIQSANGTMNPVIGFLIALLGVSIGTSAAARLLVPGPWSDPSGRLFCYALTDDQWVVGGAVSNGGSVLRWSSARNSPR